MSITVNVGIKIRTVDVVRAELSRIPPRGWSQLPHRRLQWLLLNRCKPILVLLYSDIVIIEAIVF